jgi:N-acetyl-gamma-glutamylphosphate reductase
MKRLLAVLLCVASPALAQQAPYAPATSVSAGTASTLLIAAPGTYPTRLIICTLPASTTAVWLDASPTGVAVVGSGALVPSGGGCFVFSNTGQFPVPRNAIYGITAGGSAQPLSVFGG